MCSEFVTFVLAENLKKDCSCRGACAQASFTNLRTGMGVFFVLGPTMSYTVHMMAWKVLEPFFGPAFQDCVNEKSRQEMKELKSPISLKLCPKVGYGEKKND